MSKRLTNILTERMPLAIFLAGLLAAPTAVLAQQASSDDQPATRYSPEEVRGEFAALQREDVAWRKIGWKTCLLEGLQASREQDKPIMLWIFIDRPIDDERC